MRYWNWVRILVDLHYSTVCDVLCTFKGLGDISLTVTPKVRVPEREGKTTIHVPFSFFGTCLHFQMIVTLFGYQAIIMHFTSFAILIKNWKTYFQVQLAGINHSIMLFFGIRIFTFTNYRVMKRRGMLNSVISYVKKYMF